MPDSASYACVPGYTKRMEVGYLSAMMSTLQMYSSIVKHDAVALMTSGIVPEARFLLGRSDSAAQLCFAIALLSLFLPCA
eukprot:19436-Heterococcus_DN1.PRE.2